MLVLMALTIRHTSALHLTTLSEPATRQNDAAEKIEMSAQELGVHGLMDGTARNECSGPVGQGHLKLREFIRRKSYLNGNCNCF